MKSITKRALTKDEISKVLFTSYIKDIKPFEFSELTDGYFNNSYLVKVDGYDELVLKVAPNPEVEVLTYESNLMENEVSALKIMDSMGIKVPKVLFYDNSKTIIDSEYFLMSYIPGKPLDNVKDKLSEAQLNDIYTDLGLEFNKLHSIKNNFFGELNNQDKQFSSWSLCFESMLQDLIEDAKKIDLKLPIDKDLISKILEFFSDDLKKVNEPCLIHKDLWDGNLFVNSDNFKLEGIIDTERAIWGDPLMEVVCGNYSTNSLFTLKYLNRDSFDKDELNRMNLYKLYILLIMTIECPYRKYEDNSQFNWAKQMLNQVNEGIISAMKL